MDEAKIEWALIFIAFSGIIGLRLYADTKINEVHKVEVHISDCEYEVEGYTRIVFNPSIGNPYYNNLRFIGNMDFETDSTYLLEYKINYDHRWRMKDCVILLNYWKVET